jgi:hypothetical protein
MKTLGSSERFLLAPLLLVHQRPLLLGYAALTVPVFCFSRRNADTDADPAFR